MRLKATQVKQAREAMLAQQGGRCAICKLPCSLKDARLDHDHSTGAIRAVLHNGCNALLGKVENNAPRFGVRNLAAFCGGVAAYLQQHVTNITGLLHPTHKTEDEKRLLRNKRARVARAKKKEDQCDQ